MLYGRILNHINSHAFRSAIGNHLKGDKFRQTVF